MQFRNDIFCILQDQAIINRIRYCHGSRGALQLSYPTKEVVMPTITIALNKTSEEKKKRLVENLTKAAAEITEYPAEYFFVYVQEYPAENIGVGGKTLKEIAG
jgi:4-oxalocrotonate tautomerase